MILKSQAAVLEDNNGKVNISKLKIPTINKNQVLVKIIYTGICGSQINEITGKKGKDKYLPHTLGHEAVGKVIYSYNKKSKLKNNDKVILSWIKSSNKDSSKIYYLKNKQRINSGQISTFMNYAVISENRVFKVKTKLNDRLLPLLGCAIPTSIGVFKNILTKNLKKKKIGVFGCGGIGMLTAAYLANKKIDVTGIDIVKKKLKILNKIGVKTINIKNLNKKDIIKKLNKTFDYTIDASGSEKSIEYAFMALKKRGKLIISSNVEKNKKISIDPFDLIEGKEIIGNWGGKSNLKRDMAFFLKFLETHNDFIEKNFIKIYKFKKINHAIKDMIKGTVIRPILKL